MSGWGVHFGKHFILLINCSYKIIIVKLWCYFKKLLGRNPRFLG